MKIELDEMLIERLEEYNEKLYESKEDKIQHMSELKDLAFSIATKTLSKYLAEIKYQELTNDKN